MRCPPLGHPVSLSPLLCLSPARVLSLPSRVSTWHVACAVPGSRVRHREQSSKSLNGRQKALGRGALVCVFIFIFGIFRLPYTQICESLVRCHPARGPACAGGRLPGDRMDGAISQCRALTTRPVDAIPGPARFNIVRPYPWGLRERFNQESGINVQNGGSLTCTQAAWKQDGQRSLLSYTALIHCMCCRVCAFAETSSHAMISLSIGSQENLLLSLSLSLSPSLPPSLPLPRDPPRSLRQP